MGTIGLERSKSLKRFISFKKMTMGQTTAGTVSLALAELLRVGGTIEWSAQQVRGNSKPREIISILVEAHGAHKGRPL